LLRNQPDETIHSVNKKKKMNKTQSILIQKMTKNNNNMFTCFTTSHSISRSQNVHTPL